MPITALQFLCSFDKYVHDCKMDSKVGAFKESSLSEVFHVKFLKSDIDWLLRMEFVSSKHISSSSLLSKIPMRLNK